MREVMGSKETRLLLILKADTVRIPGDQDSHEKSAWIHHGTNIWETHKLSSCADKNPLTTNSWQTKHTTSPLFAMYH